MPPSLPAAPPFPDLGRESLAGATRVADPHAGPALEALNLFRILLAGVFTLLIHTDTFSGLGRGGKVSSFEWIALAYLVLATTIWISWRKQRAGFRGHVVLGLTADLLFQTAALHSLGGLDSGLGILTLTTVASGALLLPGRLVGLLAAVATLVVLGEHFHALIWLRADRSLYQAAIYGAGFFAIGLVSYLTARQLRESRNLAQRRGVDLANLAQLNALIIQRMRTGILVVDDQDRIRMLNESAWYLMGMPAEHLRDLRRLAQALAERLQNWRNSHAHDTHALVLGPGLPSVVPRFTRLEADAEGGVLVFLEDESMVSRRAEEMTQASLGRLAASIAHEIRNPLASISYSQQLLAEAEQLAPAEQRLVQIIGNNAKRLDDIVENVLHLSRRERARPELIELVSWCRGFVDEFKAAHPLGEDALEVTAVNREVRASVDPTQLHQVVWNLCQNALRHGRRPGEAAHVILRCALTQDQLGPVLDVIDHGPGIDPKDAQSIFQPFFTTHHQGTGLGLYIARQLCEANQARLDYLPGATGGACFRLRFATPRPDGEA